MGHARPADDGAGEDTVAVVAHIRVDDAVGGHHHGAREVGKLLLLVLPGGAVVAHQMGVLLEEGIGQCGQHLAVGVDMNAGPPGLLQNELEIHHVVAGDQNALAGDGGDSDLGRFRMAEGAGFTQIQHLHDFEVELTNLHGAVKQPTHFARVCAEPAHDAVEFGGHLVTLLIQHPGVLHVGGGTLEAVEAEQAQPHDVFVHLALAPIGRRRAEWASCSSSSAPGSK